MTPESLFNELKRIIETGDLDAARTYAIAHLDDLPEDIREEVTFALFEQTLEFDTERLKKILAVQSELIEDIRLIDGVTEELDNQDRIAELKASLGVQDTQQGQ